MVKLSKIIVATRVKEGNVVSALPAARSRVEVSPEEPGTLKVISDNATTAFQFDACFDAASTSDPELILERLQVKRTLHSLFTGISVGVMGLGMDGEVPGAFSSLMSTVLRELAALVQELSHLNVSLSFALLGVTDSSCIDLVSYARKELAEIERLRTEPMGPLCPCDSLDDIINSLAAGYSLPCILMVRIFARPSSELPGSMSTLLLADLGSTAVGSPLEKSFAQLRINVLGEWSIISNQHEYGSSQDEMTHCYLTSILDEFIGGSAVTLVLADIPKTSVTRPLLHHLAMLDEMRRIKNRPVPNLETPEMLELAALVETHGRLEVEHRSVRRELKHLQRALRLAEQQHEELLSNKEVMAADNEILRWEYEYELARLGMEKLTVHEKIRQCEIDLVCMEHERLVLIAQMELKQASLTELEERLQGSLDERVILEQRYSQEIDGLASQLGRAQQQLQQTEGEKRTLEGNLQAASGRISGLETKIREITAQMDIRHAEGLKAQTAELKRLTGELNAARESEAALRRQLDDLQKAAANHQDAVHSLESKLSELKVENATLLAKIEVLSKKPQSPEISRTLRVMEEKWQVERDAMKSVMEDLRKIISDRDHSSSQTSATSLPSSQSSQAVRAQVVPGAAKGSAAPAGNRRGRRQRETQPQTEEESGASSSPRDEGHVPKVAAISHAPTPVSKEESGDASRPAAAKTALRTKQSIKLPPKQAPVKASTKTDGSDRVEKIFAAERETEKKGSTSQPMPVIDEDTVEIPGTPQKKAATQPSTTSPIKVWKPSAFIPGVSRKQTVVTSTTMGTGAGGNPKENVSSSLFANFNFSNRPADGEGLAKRIKLPERTNKPATAELGEVSMRRGTSGPNVDPAVFSTIIGSFNIPTNLGNGK